MKDRWKSMLLPLSLGLMSALSLAGTLMGLLGFDDAFLPAACAIAVLVAATIGVDFLLPSKLLSKGMALALPVGWLVGWGIPLLGELPALLHACASQAGFVLRLYMAPITALIAVLAAWLGRSVAKEYGAALMTSMAAACGVLLWILDQEALLWRLLPLLMTTLLLLMKGGVQPANAQRTMPLVALVVGVSFLFTLGGNVTVAPLKENADSLRQKILDYFFFTDARNVFSLSTEGYYPQGLSQLGGAATPDEDPVMLVSTPKKTYLRAITKDEYTGRNWRDNLGGRRYQWQASRWEN